MEVMRRAFTLIELLVVMAMVALLAALLLPALQAGRDLARRAMCLGRQRQLYGAAVLYAGDHDGWIPGGPNNAFGAHFANRLTLPRVQWARDYLGAGIGADGRFVVPCPVFHCPSSNRVRAWPENAFGVGWRVGVDYGLVSGVWFAGDDYTSYPVHLARAAARPGPPLIFSMDFSAANDLGLVFRGPFQWAVTPHRGPSGVMGLNVLTLDGAGRWVPWAQCAVNAGDAGGFHRVLPRGYDVPIYAGSASPVPATLAGRTIQVWTENRLLWRPAAEFGY